MHDTDAFPLTCWWCKSSAATHLLVTDVRAADQSVQRNRWEVCDGCAGQTTVLPPEFVGYWLYKLVPALPGDEPAGLGADKHWKALKRDLATRIDQDYAVARSFPVGSETAAAHFSLVSANRTTLAKMQELEKS